MPQIIGLTLNYRDAGRTLRCVQSLLDDGAAHVVVWDNSGDGGVCASELRVKLADEARVTIEVSEHNLGFAAGVNLGLARIRERFPQAWVLLINNDAILLAGASRALSAALAANPGAMIAYPTINHGGKLIGTAYYQRHCGLFVKKRLSGCIAYASGCCQLLAAERLAGAWFDEDFFMYGEDVELGHRLGEPCMVHVPAVWAIHEGSASSGMATAVYERQLVAAHWMLARKLSRNRLEYAVLCLGRSVALPLRAILRAWRYRSLEPLRVLVLGYRQAMLPRTKV